MGEKILVTFSIDEDIFFEFSQTVKRKGEEKNDTLERLMQCYAKEVQPTEPEPPPDNPLDKFARYKVGELANIVLRKLLESGVATEQEVIEFQKASGATQLKRLHIDFGHYVKDNFGLSFPLLITPERVQYDVGNNFYTTPLSIGGKRYYLCSQWVENLHREKLEKWIRTHLPIWLKQTDEYNRNEMIRWIESL